MPYKKRLIVNIVEEICNENNINLIKFSDDWILQLTHENKNAYITGYKFPNNNSSVCRLCDDKSALSYILQKNNIPCVEHWYFENSISPMVEENGIWSTLLHLLETHKN